MRGCCWSARPGNHRSHPGNGPAPVGWGRAVPYFTDRIIDTSTAPHKAQTVAMGKMA